MKKWINKLLFVLAASSASITVSADEFSASFKGTDIQEFVTIVGRNLNKTIIMDPTMRGKIDVRSYDVLNEEQYYKFFLNVLEVYGYAVIEMDNNVLKIVSDKNAKTAAIPVVGDSSVAGDEVITRVVTVKNVSVRELSPILRQLNDNAGAGNVVHYDPANIILLTGRAAVVNRLADIIRRVDQAGDKSVEVVDLENASATEMVRIIESINATEADNNMPASLRPKLVADERTNSVLISGEPQTRARLKQLIRQLDSEMATRGNNRVIYLRYAKAEELVEVLQGVADNLQGDGQTQSIRTEVKITADPNTNALVVTAPLDIMDALEDVIAQLDIRRAQVQIEALIVEIAEGSGIDLGVQYANLENGSLVQYANSSVPIGGVMVGLEEAKEQEGTYITNPATGEVIGQNPSTTDLTSLAAALSGLNGAALSIIKGDWTALVNAVATDSESNILSSPSITVLDNSEASIIVGEEVPVITGSSTGSNNENPFQTIERKEVGVKLLVTPQINEGNSIQMKIEQEVSNVLGANGAADIRFGKRQINTSVMVEDGQMLVLGGLISEDVQESESKIPLLGDIPYVGTLFSSTNSTSTKRNLMVFIKPTILRDTDAANQLSSRKYNYIRAEQLLSAEEGVALMPNAETPVLPEWSDGATQPDEIQAFIDLIRQSETVQ